jgi:hypothetical protein
MALAAIGMIVCAGGCFVAMALMGKLASHFGRDSSSPDP